MTEHPNATKFRQAFDCFLAGDLDRLAAEHFAPDLVWHMSGASPLAGDYKGVEEVFGLFARFMELTGGTFRPEMHDVIANDTHVVMLARTVGARGRRTLDVGEVIVMHVRDGKETEIWQVAADQQSWDAFWS